MAIWQVQEARNKFSEEVARASQGEEQIITRDDEAVVVMISVAEYEKLIATRPRLIDVLRTSPLVGSGIEIVRDQGEYRPRFEFDL